MANFISKLNIPAGTYEIKDATTFNTRGALVTHTSNLDDMGQVVSSTYTNSDSWTRTFKIQGAKALKVTCIYQTESANYDWGCVWSGVNSGYTAANNYSTSVSGKLAGTTKQYSCFLIEGNSCTIAWKTNGSRNNYYGFYAIIEPAPLPGGLTLSDDTSYEAIS